MIYLGFDNQLLSLQYELSLNFRTTEPLFLSLDTISYLCRNPTLKYKLKSTENQTFQKCPQSTNLPDGYNSLVEFPAQCYPAFIARITTTNIKTLVIFTSSPQESIRWQSATDLDLVFVSLQSRAHLWENYNPKPLFIKDCDAILTAKEYVAKGIFGGIQSGALLYTKLDSESTCLILPDSIFATDQIEIDSIDNS
jgi:hypothetical protein